MHLAGGRIARGLSVDLLLQQWWRYDALGHSRRADEKTRCAWCWLDSELSIPAVLIHNGPVSSEQR